MSNDKECYGIVVFFKNNLGYGFLSWQDESGNAQQDMFVHFSDIVPEKEGAFKTLKKGQKVKFKIGTNLRGQPKALNVEVVK